MSKVNRWFWRCADCLAVAAVEQDMQTVVMWQGQPLYKTNNFVCECGGRMQLMGRVGRDRKTLTAEINRCPCDSRCTHATGPNCECSCGGANHGTGRIVTIRVNAGGLPEASSPDKAVAEEFRAAVKAAQERILQLPFIEDFTAGRWISDRGAWERITNERRKLNTARKYVTHKRRMKALAEVAR